MRDPILERHYAAVAAYHNAGEATRIGAAELGEAAEVVSGLAGWCRLLLYDTNVIANWYEGQDLSDLLALPLEQSPLQVFSRISDEEQRQWLEKGFRTFLEKGEGRETNVLAWLFGKALATVLAESLELDKEVVPEVLPGLWNLASSHAVSRYAFEATLQALLHDDSQIMTAFLGNMTLFSATIMEDPEIGASTSEKEAFRTWVETWRTNRSIDELWKMRDHWFPVDYGLLDVVPCVWPVDRVGVLDWLDRFDFPHPVRQILQSSTILHDRDEIGAALAVAPNCSDDGKSWNYRLSSLLLLEAAENHCHDLWRAASCEGVRKKKLSQVMQETRATLSSWFEELGAIVMARSDGRFLGAQWLLLKVGDERMRRGRQIPAEDGREQVLTQEDLIEWIALGLYKAGLRGGEIEALVDFPDGSDLERVSPVSCFSTDDASSVPRLGAISMGTLLDHMIGKASSPSMRIRLDRLDTILAWRDPAFEAEGIAESNAAGVPANCCGYLFANTDDPAGRWRQSWDLLVEQRRRVQHWRETRDGNALNPSLFLLAAGMAGIEWMISSKDSDTKRHRELWGAVFEGARDCWLTVFLAPLGERIEAHIGRLFALHPRVFVKLGQEDNVAESVDTRIDRGYSKRLSEDLSCLGGNDLMVAICFLNASQNGASQETMSEVLKWNNGHIDRVLKQFERWQKVERRVRKRTDLVEKITELRNDIAQLK